ncbi:Rieske 2Fe-2S domain-containing protein [Streptomonospora nanhaiensis]|uniref:Cytochrome bc1 complex Rieske iron-sulfur subunit n=1 Tax=Streptomonospora nanhaiensis TaxID=1323731 RepID=A0A853BJS5_9ACTN|nr:Rieske 2Fe-2S domain-containing protein [Streptomonospora nanhaiensis]MBV2362389.1 Rieske (2Fe-2S) protein [Streptomonospora nanhaiensis]MBX9391727.1 Rieske (2Fe-2S) protein [Streptomonospora nanhaiensis]NYI94954.1 ubiquinol-cytochrome c reductase iron-sulfur subunit [Streptomonospora nanhaiensis]
MTDNNRNHDSETGAEGPDRVLGTPTSAEGGRVVTRTADPHEDHEGPYPAEETHVRPEAMQRRGERVAALWFTVAFLAGVGFIVAYFLFPNPPEGEPAIGDPQVGQWANMALGGTLALALFGIGAGMTVWARQVMPHYEVSSPYDELPSSPKEKSSFSDFFMRSADESGFTKRPLMRRTLLLAMAPLGLAPIVLLRDTGPLPGDTLKHTLWEPGMHMVVEGAHRTGDNHWIHQDDLEPGSMISALPYVEPTEEHPHGLSLNDQAKTVILLIRMPDGEFGPDMTREQLNWTHNGIVAYSKICTHVGCPAALYEKGSHRILCPCHQSTFDAANGAKVVFGPANRPLPQLPITVDDEGYLVADGDFSEAVGPTFWDAQRGN